MSLGTDNSRDFGMHLAFRRFLSTDTLSGVDRVASVLLRQTYSVVLVVLRVPCVRTRVGTMCPYCSHSCEGVDSQLSSHDLSFGVTRGDGLVMYVDKLYNRSSSKHRGAGGDNRWVFVRVPLSACGSSEALARKVLLPFFETQMNGKASFDTFGSRVGFVMRMTASLGFWNPRHMGCFLTHTPSAFDAFDDFEGHMGPLASDSSAFMPPRSWYCSELAITCLHLLGITNEYAAQLTTPTNLFNMCRGLKWTVCKSLDRRASCVTQKALRSLEVCVDIPRPVGRLMGRAPLQVPQEYLDFNLV